MLLMMAFATIVKCIDMEVNTYAVTFATEMLILIPCVIGVRMIGKNFFRDETFFKGVELSTLPILIMLPFFAQKFFVQFLFPIQSWLYEFAGEVPKGVDAPKSFFEFLFQMLIMCFVPAVVEEFLCRGVIMHMLKPYGVFVSVVVSALAFSLLHFEISSFLIIFMIGVIFAVLKIFTGSFWTCVVLHFANNFTAIINDIFIAHEMTEILFCLSAFSLIIFPIFMICLMKKYKKNIMKIKNEKKQKIRFSPEFCACAVLFAIRVAAKR